MTFGEWIKKRRHDLRVSLYSCAGYAGFGGEALRLIEAGKTNPADCKVSTLYGLAKILELDPIVVIERAVYEDTELLNRLEYGEKWKEREREYREACYRRYLDRARPPWAN